MVHPGVEQIRGALLPAFPFGRPSFGFVASTGGKVGNGIGDEPGGHAIRGYECSIRAPA